MPENRITNRVFYSNATPRIPIIDSSVPPTDVPDNNGGTGGETPTPPTTGVTITNGDVPNITRVNHTADIFVQPGERMSISYQADADCTLLPKGAYEDLTYFHSFDGRTITIEWDCPVDEPADSTYVGVEVWVHGQTSTTEAYAVHWDRLHIGKTQEQLKYMGTNTPNPTLLPALKTLPLVTADTLIVSNDEYTGNDDFIAIGYTGRDSEYSNAVPNGAVTPVTVDGETIQVPTAHTNIMAETPLGVVLQRNHRLGGVSVRGDYRTGPNSSGRDTHAINLLGFDLVNAPLGLNMDRADSVSINYCSSVSSTVREDTPTVNFGDGGNITARACRNSNIEQTFSMGNQRMLNLNGNENGMATWRTVYGVSGASQPKGENIVQTFVGYKARDVDWLNCWAVDDAFYAAGIRENENGVITQPNASFITTNASGHNFYGSGLLALNQVKGALMSDQPSPDNEFNESVFWQKVPVTAPTGEDRDRRPFVMRGPHSLTNITMGKHLDTADQNYHITNSWGGGATSYDKVLLANTIWDTAQDEAYAYSDSGMTWNDLYVIKPTDTVPSFLSSSPGYVQSNLLPKELGLHYISRRESGSVIEAANRGCKNLFAAKGRYGKRYLDGSREFYDGTNGLPYVNSWARGPWYEFRRARQRYACTSRGVDFVGGIGMAADGVHPVDYVNRYGTDPTQETNCPYIDDIYGTVQGTSVKLFWRPVCAAYRETITGYDLYIDGELHDMEIPANATSLTLSDVATGTKRFEIVCNDPVFGDSGKSTPVTLTI